MTQTCPVQGQDAAQQKELAEAVDALRGPVGRGGSADPGSELIPAAKQAKAYFGIFP